MTELRKPYIAVRCGTFVSYGGNQQWLPEKRRQAAACGLIAAADTLLYLDGRRELTQEEYLAYVDSLRRYFPLIPYRGIDGVRLALGMERCLRRREPRLHARWCASGERLFPRIEEMLGNDLPVILSIGPNLPAFWRGERLSLYRRTEDGRYLESAATHSHFVVATGMGETYLRISSWGRELYIHRSEYERYMRRTSMSVVTNVLYLKEEA